MTTAFLKAYLEDDFTSTIRTRGKSIFSNRKITLDEFNPEKNRATFIAISSDGRKKYDVKVKKIISEDIEGECDCPYYEEWGSNCKHLAAAVYYLIDSINNHNLVRMTTIDKKNVQPASFDMRDSQMHLPTLQDHYLLANSNKDEWKKAKAISKINVITAQNSTAHVQIQYKSQSFEIKFAYNSKTKIAQTSCSCAAALPVALCSHKLAALFEIRNMFGLNALHSLRDLTAEKTELLKPYGYTIEEAEKTKFFSFKNGVNGKLTLIVKDPSLRPIDTKWDTYTSPLGQKSPDNTATTDDTDNGRRLFYCFDFNNAPHQALDPFFPSPYSYSLSKLGKPVHIRPAAGSGEKIAEPDAQDLRIAYLRQKYDDIYFASQMQKMSGNHINHYFIANYPSLSAELKSLFYKLIGKALDEFLYLLKDKDIYYKSEKGFGRISTATDITPLRLAEEHLRLRLWIEEDEHLIHLKATAYTSTQKSIPLPSLLQPQQHNFWLCHYNSVLYKWHDFDHAWLANLLTQEGKISVSKVAIERFLQEFLLPVSQRLDIDFKNIFKTKYDPLTPVAARIYLREHEDTLQIVPSYQYESEEGDLEFPQDQRSTKLLYKGRKNLHILQRDPDWEQSIWERLVALHPNFTQQKARESLSLSFAQVLAQEWFFKFTDALNAEGIQILGIKDLKRLRYNPNRPQINIRASSGIDWFDMQMEIAFGDQFVSLSDVRKAVQNRQNYVLLQDGTLGLLPKEWLEKYTKLFAFGKVQGDSLKISKLHFNLIDDLLAQSDDAALQQELAEKKQKLLHFKEIPNLAIPTGVHATLREYQHEGFKWLNFLREFGWGGCLADDMGLGKTVQIITLLQHHHSQSEGVSLVVVPTSLIFNWEAEVQKFCPTLRLCIYRGVDRNRDHQYFHDYDIILTSYGTLRQDIVIFQDFKFEYIILDESQAIKNPQSLISKAVRLLQAKHRLTMTGTPIENNTFDLYSQFEFLNPGFLGSEDFFKNEFANPIDRNQDIEKAKQLRRLLYPFMLKRTKEEVATDLPDKTETILYCEMGKAQRKVYDTFREYYRQRIAGKLDEEGKEKSLFLILEGLLKLRQICDSPAILNTEENYGNESAKLAELVREIEENTSNHKILIFSQFIQMLSLVRTELEKRQIIYEYLDGQTQDRASKVRRFQDDAQCRIFLISLKAGGVGLNLTAADYVYLIDPWWNPAVEAQAIDRTHRIGQDKKVFAYKMICKDTIEEKILLLQQRKQALAEELVGAETGFIKKLSQKDIIELFS